AAAAACPNEPGPCPDRRRIPAPDHPMKPQKDDVNTPDETGPDTSGRVAPDTSEAAAHGDPETVVRGDPGACGEAAPQPLDQTERVILRAAAEESGIGCPCDLVVVGDSTGALTAAA